MVSKAETGYSFGKMSIRANLIIPRGEEQARAIKLLYKAKGLCLVARAPAIKQTFEHAVKVAASAAGGRA